jgi:hypothetical protein
MSFLFSCLFRPRSFVSLPFRSRVTSFVSFPFYCRVTSFVSFPFYCRVTSFVSFPFYCRVTSFVSFPFYSWVTSIKKDTECVRRGMITIHGIDVYMLWLKNVINNKTLLRNAYFCNLLSSLFWYGLFCYSVGLKG